MLVIAPAWKVNRIPLSPMHITSQFPSRQESNFQEQERKSMPLQHETLLIPFREQQSRTLATARSKRSADAFSGFHARAVSYTYADKLNDMFF